MQTEIVLSAAERLKLARQRAGLDQAQMGDLIGVHRGVISQYENGRTEPTLSSLVRWADAADVSLDWLCARRDSNPQPSDLYPDLDVELAFWAIVEPIECQDSLTSDRASTGVAR